MIQKRVYIETYGCQMNEHDSEQMLWLLEREHYLFTEKPEEADLILINSCSVREKPEHKVYSALGRYKKLKKKGVIVAVAGCVAQQEGEKLLERVPYLDLVIGTQAIHLLPQLVQRVEAKRERVCETSLNKSGEHLNTILPQKDFLKVKSYVTIMQGCDHFCSFCIVPYVRGRERSRPSGEILKEIEHLVQRGVREVCLLGQNVNSYGKGKEGEIGFPELLKRVNEIEGLKRIRFTTSHPMDLSLELIESYSALEKLCEHIHLPFQSGSDKILKAMHRGYSRDSYLEKIHRLREACPSIAITADVMVGFPGEEEEDFEKTLSLIQEVQFDDLYSFKYSPRKGTRAEKFDYQIGEKEKESRLAILQALQREITLKKNKAMEGRVEEVLVEGLSKQNDQELMGRTRSNKIVNFLGDIQLVGKLVWVRITQGYTHSLRGELLGMLHDNA
ncbi:MAG: tRNA (N6-isopentenyl adenosine(37)-C2)-methylthiotransferase MiaB [Thermodesulfobacteriota bacterium]